MSANRKHANFFGSLSQLAVLGATLVAAMPLLALDVHAPPGASIQTAIDQVHAAGGGSVSVSAGNYPLKTSLLIRSNVRLVGAGQGMTVISYGGGGNVISQASEGLANVTLEGLTVKGTRSDHCYGIFLASLRTYHTNIHILNCEVTSSGMGIHIKRARGVTVSGCHLHGNGSIGKEGFYHSLYIRQCDGIERVQVVNCLLNDCLTGNGLNLSYNKNVYVSAAWPTTTTISGESARPIPTVFP